MRPRTAERGPRRVDEMERQRMTLEAQPRTKGASGESLMRALQRFLPCPAAAAVSGPPEKG